MEYKRPMGLIGYIDRFDWLFNRPAISSSSPITHNPSRRYNRNYNKDTEERLKANRRWCNRLDSAVAFCPVSNLVLDSFPFATCS